MSRSMTLARFTLVVAVSIVLVASGIGYAHGPDGVHEQQTEVVRDATEAYRHDPGAAVADGYLPTDQCVGGMGYHYVNPGLIDAEENPRQPEVLVYAENDTTGDRELVAVEYLSTEQDELFGHEFEPFHRLFALHAWVWLDNPAGTFQDVNDAVTTDCTF